MLNVNVNISRYITITIYEVLRLWRTNKHGGVRRKKCFYEQGKPAIVFNLPECREMSSVLNCSK